MTRKTGFLVMASVLVSSILLEGQVFAAGERKKLVQVSNSTEFNLLLGELLAQPLNGIHVVYPLPVINTVAIELPSTKTVTDGLADLRNLILILGIPLVHYDVYNDLLFSVLPVTPARPDQVPLPEAYAWGHVHTHVPAAHLKWPELLEPLPPGQEVMNVAIVDTGIACVHPDLPVPIDGVDAFGVSFCDGHGHGTHTAGIIAARKNQGGLSLPGIIGADPQGSLVAVKVLDHNGKGYLSNLLYGLHWIHDNHIRLNIGLVNMSLGFSEGSPPLYSMIEKLHDLGIIMVAAAGNKCPTSGGQEESGGDEGQGVCKDPQTTIRVVPQ